MRSSRTYKEQDKSPEKSVYEEYFSKLEGSFRESIQIIVNDPIMECFKENKESQMFMFERIKEVVTQSLQEAQDDYNKEALQRLDDMRDFTSSLREEIKQVSISNKNLKEKLKKKSQGRNSNQGSLEVKSLQIENEKLENNMQEIRKELKDAQIKVRDSENLLNWKEDVVKKLEDTIMQLESENNSARAEMQNLSSKLKETMDQETKYRNLYLDLKSNQGGQMSSRTNDKCVNCERLYSQLKKMKREKNQLEKMNSELERVKQHDLKSTQNRNDELEKELNDKDKMFFQKDQKIEDLEFTVKQLEQTVATFKRELTESTKRVREERKYRHSVEISMIELKDSFSELTLEAKSVRDENQKSRQELEYIKNLLQTKEVELKNQRRRAATLERELEQTKFSSETNSSALLEKLNSYQEISNAAKLENQSLESKIEKLISNFQHRIEDERNSHHKTKETLERSLEKVERLDTAKDNLEKKVESLKNKILSMYGDSKEMEPETSIPKEVQTKIRNLEERIRKIKTAHNNTKYSMRQDLKFSQKYVKDIFQLLVQKLKEERRKCHYYEKDIARLKKDLSYLERINKDYSGSSFKLNLEPFKSIMNIQEKNDNNKIKERDPREKKNSSDLKKKNFENNTKKIEKENFGKKIGLQNVKGSAVFLSPIKPAEEQEEIKKLEISEIEKESIEIERRISRLREKSKRYSRDYSGMKIIQ